MAELERFLTAVYKCRALLLDHQNCSLYDWIYYEKNDVNLVAHTL